MEYPEIRPVELEQLFVDPEVQRTIEPRKVQRIADDLNEAALGTITLSERDDKKYHIVDGQHRVAALLRLVEPSYKVNCRVFRSLTRSEEAELFRLLNTTSRPSAVDSFRIRVIEGDPAAVFIVRVLTDNNWKLATGSSDRMFAAVAAIERVYKFGEDAVVNAITTTTRAWGHQQAAGDGRVVEGLGLVHARYGTAIDVDNLVERLHKYPDGPAKLIGNARTLSDVLGTSVARAMAESIVEIYNKGKTTRALPHWRS